MSKFKTSLQLDPDVVEARVDEIGKAVLTEQARNHGLRVTGEVERIYDEYVVGVPVVGADGNKVITHVPVGSPQAGGRTKPDAREVTWQTDVEPITPDPALRIVGEVNGRVSTAALPETITRNGGMIAFQHNLGGPVLVTVQDAEGLSVAYELAVEITDNEQQVQLSTPGGVHIAAVRDDEEDGQ